MNELEIKLKELILTKYGSLKKFTETIDMPWTTLDSILKRGVANSNITNVLNITQELGIDTESLVKGNIVPFTKDYKAEQSNSVVLTPEEHALIHKYNNIDIKGRHTVDTVLEMEYIRCNKPYLLPNAAHEIKGATEAEKQHDNDLMDNDDIWK